MLVRYPLTCLILCSALSANAAENAAPPPAAGEDNDVEFNDQFLYSTGSNIDVHRYSRGNPVTPGNHRVTIAVNGITKVTTDVDFKDNGAPRPASRLTR